jgi:hypothetical protein
MISCGDKQFFKQFPRPKRDCREVWQCAPVPFRLSLFRTLPQERRDKQTARRRTRIPAADQHRIGSIGNFFFSFGLVSSPVLQRSAR